MVTNKSEYMREWRRKNKQAHLEYKRNWTREWRIRNQEEGRIEGMIKLSPSTCLYCDWPKSLMRYCCKSCEYLISKEYADLESSYKIQLKTGAI